jgi:drug/metabolite transporter (DMT)-like permease
MAGGVWVKCEWVELPTPDYQAKRSACLDIAYNPVAMDRKHFAAYIEVSFAVVVWGASFIATKLALYDLRPVTVVWLRFAIGVVILGIAASLKKQFTLPHKKDILYLSLLGFLGITFHQWLQSTGLQTVQASTTAWIVATSPVFIAILSWLFLREKLVWVQIIGIALAAVGVLLVVSKGNLAAIFTGHFGTPGDILILISAPNWAVFSIISSYGLKKFPATQMMFYVMVIGWLLTSILFFSAGNVADLRHLTFSSLIGIGFLGIFCSGLAYIAWYDGLQALPATQIGAFLYLEPLVAVLVAWAILGESLIPVTLLGGAVILLGVRLVQKSVKSRTDQN